jgi:hypothetical protein
VRTLGTAPLLYPLSLVDRNVCPLTASLVLPVNREPGLKHGQTGCFEENILREVGESRGVGVERGDGLDEAGDGEGVAHTADTTNQMERSAFPGELN